MSSKMFMYFFLQSKRIFIHIVRFNGLQTVESQNYSSSAASKGYKRFQMMNKGLI